MASIRARVWLFVLPVTVVGCSEILGLDRYGTGVSGGAAGSAATSSGGSGTSGPGGTGAGGTTMSASGGSAGAGAGGTAGAGGSAGAGGTGGGTTSSTSTTSTTTTTTMECSPGAMQPCYDGPAGTENVGVCQGGTSTCDASGTWGPCVGQTLPSPELCNTGKADESCDGNPQCTGGYRWVHTFGSPGQDTARAVATDSLGNVIVVGVAAGPIDFGQGTITPTGGKDAFVIKLDPDGKVLWAKMFGSAADDAAYAVGVDPAQNILIGGSGGAIDFGFGPLKNMGGPDVFVAKLHPDGSPIWASSYGGPGDDELADLAVGPDGDPYVIGSYTGVMSFLVAPLPDAGASQNVFVARLKGLGGAPMWQKGYGDGAAQIGRSIAVDPAGDVAVAIDLSGAIQLGGAALSEMGGGDIAVAKLAGLDGSYVWGFRYGDAAAQNVTVVRAMPDGSFVFAGHVTGTVDFGGGATTGGADRDVAVWRLAANGTFVYARRATGSSDSFAWGLAIDSKGWTTVTGAYLGAFDLSGGSMPLPSAAKFDRFVMKLGPGSGIWWEQPFPNTVGAITAAATDGQGRVIFAGGLNGASNFGPQPVDTGANGMDILVGGLSP
jgi:hypothetical protein